MNVQFLQYFFRDTRILYFSDIFVNLVPLDYSRRKNRSFLKNTCLTLKEGTLSKDHINYHLLEIGTKRRRYLGDYLLKIL